MPLTSTSVANEVFEAVIFVRLPTFVLQGTGQLVSGDIFALRGLVDTLPRNSARKRVLSAGYSHHEHPRYHLIKGSLDRQGEVHVTWKGLDEPAQHGIVGDLCREC